jgi:hypothetical protein
MTGLQPENLLVMQLITGELSERPGRLPAPGRAGGTVGG